MGDGGAAGMQAGAISTPASRANGRRRACRRASRRHLHSGELHYSDGKAADAQRRHTHSRDGKAGDAQPGAISISASTTTMALRT